MIRTFSDMILADNIDEVNVSPQQASEYLILLYCEAGELQMSLNDSQYMVHPDNVVVCMPQSLIGHYMRTPDFQAKVLAVGRHFFDNVLSDCFEVEPNWWQKALFVRDNPVFTITDFQSRLLHAYYQLITTYAEDSDTPYRQRIIRTMAQAAAYEILAALDEAIICNLCAILFIVFRTNYGLTFEQLGRLVLINFCVQMLADTINGLLIHKVDARKILLIGSSATFLGYLCFAILPMHIPPYMGLVISTVIISWGCGTYEMMLSPLINAIPSDTKVQDMALLHSFYAWGVAFAVLFATVFFFTAGFINTLIINEEMTLKSVFYFGLFKYWYLLPLTYALVPLVLLYNFSKMKMPQWISEEERTKLKDFITKPYFILVALAIALGGGVECILSNWISIFSEKALGYNKFIGDMIGLFGYAITMGIGRHLMGTRGENWDLSKTLIFASIISVFVYVVAALCPINIICLIVWHFLRAIRRSQ